MTPENFVAQIQSAVIEENTSIYTKLFQSTPPNEAKDPYWNRALALYTSLNEADRIILFQITRQAMIDTVSNLFSILDGVTVLDGSDESFILTSQPDNQKLNGNLQDLFLEGAEQ